MSQTEFAILGMLTIEPMSGYDMKKLSEQSLAHFWHESYGNLYPRLKRLEKRGFIVGRTERRGKGPAATVYTLTERGRERFLEWMEEPPVPERLRSEILLKVFFGGQIGRRQIARHIQAHMRHQEALRSTYAEIATMLHDEADATPEAPFWRMTLRRGQLLTEARLRWCRECLAELEEEEQT